MKNKETKEPYIGEPMKSLKEAIVKKNLFQKLIEIRKSVSYIKKGGQSYEYEYTKESQLQGSIKDAMDNQGVWIDQDTVSIEPCEIAIYVKKTKSIIKVEGIRGIFKFTITDCDNPSDFITRQQIVQDSGSDVKTIGGLQTYANKYFLFKFFNIPNDSLDPDQFEKSIEVATTTTISEAQVQEIRTMLNGDKEAWQFLSDKFGYSKVSSISSDVFQAVVNELNVYIVRKKAKEERNNE